ncbi:MAG TPA: hypothetical protein VMK16_17020 [Acidimicrobiales bacterium]|nr:hypothetical protein [Acidimicrobiales bacterium]
MFDAVAASLIADDVAIAVVLGVFYVACAIGAYIWAGGSGDVAAIMRAGGDERQRALDRDATAVAGLAVACAAITGAIVEIARGNGPGASGVMCVVCGLSYTIALYVLHRRR